MRLAYTPKFRRQFNSLPAVVRQRFYKQAVYLLKDLRHPSLRAKKYDETKQIWQARVDRNIRFYFVIERDTYVLLSITRHPQ